MIFFYVFYSVYVELGNNNNDFATLTFNFATGTANTRIFEIKVNQIPCGGPSR